MSFDSIPVLDVPITISNKSYILENIDKYIKNNENKKIKLKNQTKKPLVIYTPNPEIINYASQSVFFRKTVAKAQINLPDGEGVVWALKKIANTGIKRISGADFIKDLCFLALENSVKIGLIGGRENVALESAECLKKNYRGLKIHVFKSPKVEIIKKGEEESCFVRSKTEGAGEDYFNNLAGTIIRKEIKIFFVALGFPKQEYFIGKLQSKIEELKSEESLVLMSVGGAFDYISGRVKRAPIFIRNLRLEWLYRFIAQPWRLTRQLSGGMFFYRVLAHKKENQNKKGKSCFLACH